MERVSGERWYKIETLYLNIMANERGDISIMPKDGPTALFRVEDLEYGLDKYFDMMACDQGQVDDDPDQLDLFMHRIYEKGNP